MEQQRIKELLETRPKLREQDKLAVNRLFDAYIFRRRRTREIWTSCCLKHTELYAGHPLLNAPHEKKPKLFGWGCSHGVWSAPRTEPPAEPASCPLCGTTAAVKELGRCGKRGNLWSYCHVVIMRKQEGVLWALAYEASKDYAVLTDFPRMFLVGVYRFDGTRAEYIGRGNWTDSEWFRSSELEAGSLPRKWSFNEPFNWCHEYGNDYEIIDLDGEDGTPYAYCRFGQYTHGRQMKFLALCTVYPRQVEMLMKAGLDAVIEERIRGKLNTALFDWNDQNPFRSFGVPKEALQQWLHESRRPAVLVAYKRFIKAKLPVTLEQTLALYDTFGDVYFERLTSLMRRYGVGYDRITNYLTREGRRKQKGRRQPSGTYAAAHLWCDYMQAAAVLGLDLKNPVYLLPKDLLRNHDEKTAAAAALAEKTGGRSRVRNLTKQYTFWNDRWLIRPPVCSAEIVAEGEKLKHCVGGYAERHAKGRTTILFLRDKLRPGRPLVTIEMHGTYICQIHGFRNETEACRANPKRISPRTLYKDFLDAWIAWLEAGSKRNRRGEPVMPEAQRARVPA